MLRLTSLVVAYLIMALPFSESFAQNDPHDHSSTKTGSIVIKGEQVEYNVTLGKQPSTEKTAKRSLAYSTRFTKEPTALRMSNAP